MIAILDDGLVRGKFTSKVVMIDRKDFSTLLRFLKGLPKSGWGDEVDVGEVIEPTSITTSLCCKSRANPSVLAAKRKEPIRCGDIQRNADDTQNPIRATKFGKGEQGNPFAVNAFRRGDKVDFTSIRQEFGQTAQRHASKFGLDNPSFLVGVSCRDHNEGVVELTRTPFQPFARTNEFRHRTFGSGKPDFTYSDCVCRLVDFRFRHLFPPLGLSEQSSVSDDFFSARQLGLSDYPLGAENSGFPRVFRQAKSVSLGGVVLNPSVVVIADEDDATHIKQVLVGATRSRS